MIAHGSNDGHGSSDGAGTARAGPRAATLIGWREWVGLPGLGIRGIRAKIDTGARTTALHATDIERVDPPSRDGHDDGTGADGTHWLAFTVPAGDGHGSLRVEAPMVEERAVKNTSGVPDPRPVIRTTLSIDRRRWPIEVTLADRTEMGFDIILGRTAIRRRGLLVNPGRSFLVRPPAGFHPPALGGIGDGTEDGGGDALDPEEAVPAEAE